MSDLTFDDLVPHAPPGRFDGIRRPYSPDDVARLRGSLTIQHTLAERGANKLWALLHDEPFVNALGAMTGNQAMQQVRAGLKAIYLSGWQVAADANTAGAMYPDQSLYPANAAPELCRRINRTLRRADEIEASEGKVSRDWYAPIVADAEAGFGGPLNSFEIMKAFIEGRRRGRPLRGPARLGEEVRPPRRQGPDPHRRARAQPRRRPPRGRRDGRAHAHRGPHRRRVGAAHHLGRGRARPPLHRPREPHARGLLPAQGRDGLDHCIARGLAYAEVADLLWWETSHPDLDDARRFAEAVHREHPGKLLAYNCSPSFNWQAKLDEATIARFQRELGAMGYKFQFVTLAGFHALNLSMFDLADGYRDRGMAAYSEMQQREFAAQGRGFTAVRHQREVGTGYFDQVAMTISQAGPRPPRSRTPPRPPSSTSPPDRRTREEPPP